jgi:hypothetical protein
MLDNTGRAWVETHYQGYGVFGGMDYYILVDLMNGGKGDRERGIAVAHNWELLEMAEPALPKFVEVDNMAPYGLVSESGPCPNQGYFYDESL